MEGVHILIDGEPQTFPLAEVTRYRYSGYGYHGGGRPAAGRCDAVNVRIPDWSACMAGLGIADREKE